MRIAKHRNSLGLVPLPVDFYTRDPRAVSRDLLGKVLVRCQQRKLLTARIVEVEAYLGLDDPASHSFSGRTHRNFVLFGPPGFSYIYRSYGIHWCANFVCEEQGSASAVLIRALEPTHGMPLMRRRRGLHDARSLCSGPGKLCEALGITIAQSELPLDKPPIALHARIGKVDIVSGLRIGITKAVDLPWRYGLKGSKFLSKPFMES